MYRILRFIKVCFFRQWKGGRIWVNIEINASYRTIADHDVDLAPVKLLFHGTESLLFVIVQGRLDRFCRKAFD